MGSDSATAAPLEKAVAQGRAAMARWDKPEPVPVLRHSDAVDCVLALRSLLAALDAAPWWSVWQKTYEHQRKAEDALEEIRDSPTAVGKDIARRYFARLEVPE